MIPEKTVVNEGTETQPTNESLSEATKAYIAGIHAWQGNDLREAAVDFRRAAALDVEPLLRRGWARVYVAEIEGLQKHRLRKRLALWRARRDFQEALRRGEGLAAVYEGLGVAYRLGGNEDLARSYLYSALFRDKHLPLALDTLCRLEIGGGCGSAVEPILDEAIELQPEDLNLRILRAKVRSSENKLAEAATDFAFVVERDASRADAVMDLAHIQVTLGDFSSAEASMKRALAESAGNRPRSTQLSAVRIWADTAEICSTFERDAAAILQGAREVQHQARTCGSIRQLEVLRFAFTDWTNRVYLAATQRFDRVIEAAMAYQRDVLASWRTESSPLHAAMSADLEQEVNAAVAHLEEDQAPEHLLSSAKALQMSIESINQAFEVFAHLEPVRLYAIICGLEEQVKNGEAWYSRRAGLWRAGRLAANTLSVIFWFIGAALLINKFLSVFELGVLDFLGSRYSTFWSQIEIPVGVGWILFGLFISRVRQLSDRRTLSSLRDAFVDLAGTRAVWIVHILSQGIWLEAASPLPNSGMSLAELIGTMSSADKPMSIREQAGFHTRRTQGDPSDTETAQLYQVLTADEVPRTLRLSSALLMARKGDRRAIPMLQDTVILAEERCNDDAVSVLCHIESGRLAGSWLWSENRSGNLAQYLVKDAVKRAILALGQIKDPSATDVLLSALETSRQDGEQEAIVVEALRLQATRNSIDALATLAVNAIHRGESPAVFLESLAKTENPQAGDVLLKLLDHSEQEGVQKGDFIRALALSSHLSLGVPLVEQLRSLDDMKFEKLVRGSQFPKSPTGQFAMRKLASDETTEPARRWIAIQALAEHDVDEAEALALHLWEHSKTPRGAIETLVKNEANEAEALTLRPSEHSKLPREAIEALATIGTPRTLEELSNVVRAAQTGAPDAAAALGGGGQPGLEVLRKITEDKQVDSLGRAFASAELVLRDKPGADLDLIVRILADEEVPRWQRGRLVDALVRFDLFTGTTGSWTALTRIACDPSIRQELRDKAAWSRESVNEPAEVADRHAYQRPLWSSARQRLERLLARSEKRDTRV